ncbi:MAG: FKBP-type peptidyl-prolyl cis-trans isomerase [Prevotella sp.]|nr:FKBP-type peptidyl-prolyl cis-trans isomerase [Prevotella sp.]
MKKLVIIALALVAGASSYTAEAAKKKVAQKPAAEAVKEVVRLNGSSDSVSYAAGMSLTNGLIPYLVQQQNVDTAYMADFVRGFQEVIKSGDDPKMKACQAGMDIARQLRERMLPGITKEFQDSPDSIVSDLLFKGFADALLKDSSVFKQADAEAYFKAKQTADKAAKEEKLWGPNREAGRKFLAENAKKDSVITLPSGLQYKVLVMGNGEVPKIDDKVLVNYEGRLIDGTVFDASRKHGDKPSEFRPNQVIKSWQEALTMMPVGSKWQLFIPYELAYGEREAGQIKPFSALIFDVVLEGIDKPKTEEAATPVTGDKKQKTTKKGKK